MSGRRFGPEIPIFGALAVALFLASLSWTVATNDEAIWHYIGWAWIHGHPPYTAAVENKGPGVFSLYALSSLFFGIGFGPVRLVGVCAVIGTMLSIYSLVRRHVNARAGLLAGLVFGLANCWTAVDAGFPESTESFEVLFTALAFLAALSRPLTLPRAIAAGILAGVAVSFKQSAIFTGAALLAALVLQGASVLQLAVFAAGGLGGIALFLVPVLLSGARFGDYVQFSWLVLTYKGISGAPTLNIRLDSFITAWGGPMRLFIPFAAAFFLRRRHLTQVTGIWWPVCLWLASGFIMVNSSGVTHAHQIKEVLAPLSIVVALGTEQLIGAGAVSFVTAAVALAIAFFPDGAIMGFRHLPHYLFNYRVDGRVLADVPPGQAAAVAPLAGKLFSKDELDFQMGRALGPSYATIADAVHHDALHFAPLYVYEDVAMRDLGEYLRNQTARNDAIFVFGRGPAALAMLYSDRQSSTRFFCNILLYGYNASENPKFLSIMLQELRTTPPVLLAIPADPTAELPYVMPAWLRQLASGYSKITTRDGFDVYRRTAK